MGATTLTRRAKPARFEYPALWDTEAALAEELLAASDSEPTDHLAGFAGAIVNVRWATTTVAALLASSSILDGDWPVLAGLILIVASTAYHTYQPLRYTGSPTDQLRLLAEVCIYWLVLSFTGFWASPLVIAAAAPLVVAGFAGGFRLALRIGGATCLSLTLVSSSVNTPDRDLMAESLQWSSLLLLTAVIAAYGRRISGEARKRQTVHLDRITQLTDANNLLSNLHRLTQTLPASLDRTEVLDSSLASLRGLIDYERAAVLLVESSDQTWSIARSRGLDIGPSVAPANLPQGAQAAIADRLPTLQPSGGLNGQGAHPSSVGALYAPLVARDRLIGLVMIESSTQTYDELDRRTFTGFIEPMSLAVDNANWFRSIRQASVDEERSRIARELHDRIGQLLASLGFEVDRLIRHEREGRDLGASLAELREGVRSVTGEVRDALYDLRSDVSEHKDFASAMTEFADRVSVRSGLAITVDAEAEVRLPIRQEREMWRIAQEALINVERHAEASEATVRWRCDQRRASLEVVDDGKGMKSEGAGRVDSYGIVGMRERASGVGAALEILSQPGEGTTVRCNLSQI